MIKRKLTESTILNKDEALELLANYILDYDREVEDFEEYVNNTGDAFDSPLHIVGVAKQALSLLEQTEVK